MCTHLNVYTCISGIAHMTNTHVHRNICIEVHESLTHSMHICAQADSNTHTKASTWTGAQVHRANYTIHVKEHLDTHGTHHLPTCSSKHLWERAHTCSHTYSQHTPVTYVRTVTHTFRHLCKYTHTATAVQAGIHTHMHTGCLAHIITHPGKIHIDNYY